MDDHRFRRIDPPDEIELELLVAGALDDDPDRRAAAVLAASGDLSEIAADLERFRAGWAPSALPRPIAPAPANTNRWYGALALLAAVALLAILAWRTPDDGIRPMGGLPVDLVVARAGAAMDPSTPLAAGDLLDLALVAPRPGYLYVATVQDDGQVTVLYHTVEPLRAGQRFDLPGAIELDAYAGREWLVVVMTNTPPAESLLVETVGDMLPEPGAAASSTLWVREVTRRR